MTRLPVQSGLRRLATACIHYARQPRSSLTPSTAPARPAAPTLAQLDFEQLESRRPVRLQPAAATSRSALVAQPPIPDSLVRTTPAGGGEAPLSNRKKFQAVQPLPSVMGYLAARQMGKGRVRSTRDKYGPQLYPAAHQLLMPQYTSLKSRMKLIVAAQNPSQFPDRVSWVQSFCRQAEPSILSQPQEKAFILLCWRRPSFFHADNACHPPLVSFAY